MSSDHQRQHETAAAPEHEPLPPLPDGGLGRVMPAWLRDDPANAGPPSSSAIDPASLVSADDLPVWLRQLGQEPPPAPAPTAAPPRSGTTATVPPPHEQPVTLAIPTSPSDDEPPPAPAPAPPTPQNRPLAPAAPAVTSTLTRTPMPAVPQHDPDLARRKAIVATLGFLLLVLVVAVYIYARGGL